MPPQVSVPGRPYALLSWGQDTLWINRILKLFHKSPIRVVVEVVGIGHQIHVVDVGSVLAEASPTTLTIQFPEYLVDRPSVFGVGLVEHHHSHKNDVSLMHEEVAKEVEVLGLADGARCPHPVEHGLPRRRDDG